MKVVAPNVEVPRLPLVCPVPRQQGFRQWSAAGAALKRSSIGAPLKGIEGFCFFFSNFPKLKIDSIFVMFLVFATFLGV